MEHYLEITSVAKTIQICHLPHVVLGRKSSFSGTGHCSPNSNTVMHVCKQRSNSLFLRRGCSELILYSPNVQGAPVFRGGRPSWLNLFDSKEYTDRPTASDFCHKSLFSFSSLKQNEQLVESGAEAGDDCSPGAPFPQTPLSVSYPLFEKIV